MNGRMSTRLRREAEERTVGENPEVTKTLYKTLKSNYILTGERSDYQKEKIKELATRTK